MAKSRRGTSKKQSGRVAWVNDRTYQAPVKSLSMEEDCGERRFVAAPPLQAMHPLQAKYINCLTNCPITIATGYAGTGKTYIAARVAAKMLKDKKVESIVLSRPALSASKSLGYFKGTKEEKMLGWLAPVMGALKECFSPGQIKYMIKEDIERITFLPLELIKGMSWKDAFVIIDEAEDCTFKELESILTRIGTNSRLVLSGDVSQTDLLNKVGIQEVLKMKCLDPKFGAHIEHIHFNEPNAIVRSDECREMILGFERARARA
jgi:phosphate starvation-inducible protein PhoH and related proteins